MVLGNLLNYRLANLVEIDDAYFGGPDSGDKRGRGSSKNKVTVEVSITEDGNPQFAKMKVVDKITGDTVKKAVKESIAPGSTIKSDGYTSYKVLKKTEYKHSPEVVKGADVAEVLHWVHFVISNAKAFINGTYHGLVTSTYKNILMNTVTALTEGSGKASCLIDS